MGTKEARENNWKHGNGNGYTDLSDTTCCDIPKTSRQDLYYYLSFIVGRWKLMGPYWILWITIIATASTFVASWSCQAFYSADTYSTDGGYGVWSLEDSGGHCQLWGVLFFTHQLDVPLKVARFLSMMAMLASLATIAILTQIIHSGKVASWMMAIVFAYWLLDSIEYWWRFNVWSIFFIITYLWLVLFTKIVLLKHYSFHSLMNVARPLMLICCGGGWWVVAMLASRACMQHDFLTIEDDDLEQINHDKQDFNPYSSMTYNVTFVTHSEDTSGQCVLGPNITPAIVSPLLWLLGWLLSHLFPFEEAGYSETEEAKREMSIYRHRPRLDTDTTLGTSDDEIDEEEHYPDDDHSTGSKSEPPRDESRSCDKTQMSIPLKWNDDNNSMNSSSMMIENPRFLINVANVAVSHREQDAFSNWEPHTRPSTSPNLCRIERVCWYIVTLFEFLIVVVLIGSYFENKSAAMAPNTSYNFVTDVVCAFDKSSGEFETFDSPQQAQKAGFVVAHCGACGECSNPSDIERYVETRNTVADQAKKCSMQAIFGSDEELLDCLESEIGFTRSCTTCWAENMRNTAKHCMWTCLSSTLTGTAANNTIEDAKDYDWLNQCVFCDEKHSGPAFVECSGVARRRLGIPSEFKRNPLEVCTMVQVDYLDDDWKQIFA